MFSYIKSVKLKNISTRAIYDVYSNINAKDVIST